MNTTQSNDRLVLDSDYVYQDIEKILDEIRAIRSDRSFTRYVGNTLVQSIKDYETLIHNRLNDTFNLVIVGDFKRGKSTFINALIGSKVLPSAVTPETVTINKLTYSETQKVEAVLKNGRRMLIDLQELKREELEKITRQLPAPIECIEVKDSHEFLKGVSIIDTPGIGDLFKAYDEQVANYLLNADAVIYIVSAKAPLSMTELNFLSTSVMPQSFSRVLLVVNMADCLDSVEDIERIKTLAKEKTQDISSNIFVYTVSALDELSRKMEVKRPNVELAPYLENNFLELENALQNDVLMKKDIIKSTRGISLTHKMLSNLNAKILLLENSLKTNVEKLASAEEGYLSQNSKLEEAVARHKQNLSADVDLMRLEARGWMDQFLSRLNNEIKRLQGVANQAELERHFQFFMDDMVKQAFMACVERHKKDISDKIESEARDLAADVSRSTFGTINAQIADCITDVSWTGVDTAMFFAGDILQLNNTLGIFYLAIQAVAGFVRQQVINKKQKDFLNPVITDFELIRLEVLSKVDEVYNQLKNIAADQLDNVYQDQINASMDAIKQAQEIARLEDVKTDEVISYLDSVLETINTLEGSLSKYD